MSVTYSTSLTTEQYHMVRFITLPTLQAMELRHRVVGVPKVTQLAQRDNQRLLDLGSQNTEATR